MSNGPSNDSIIFLAFAGHPFTFNVGGGKAAKFGVAADIRSGGLTAVTAWAVWQMTLSSDQESLT